MTDDWRLPPAIPRRGGFISRTFGRIALRLMGWHIQGEFPDVPRVMAIVAPHTTNWDFIVGVAAKFGLGLDVSWLGKHTLFKPPMGPLFRWLGGIPVDRTASHDVVTQTIQAFNEHERLVIVITPEGTRKKVERWRTGFYHIAFGAHVPILAIVFDWKRRIIHIGPTFTPTGDVSRDLPEIQSLFARAEA